jgi:hypothetical protein
MNRNNLARDRCLAAAPAASPGGARKFGAAKIPPNAMKRDFPGRMPSPMACGGFPSAGG